MASYRIIIRRDAQAEFLAVPFPFRRQINQRIHALKSKPRPDTSQLVFAELRLLRVSGWRVLYAVDDDRMTLTVISILPPQS